MNIFLLVVCSDYTVIQSVNIQECVQLPPPPVIEKLESSMQCLLTTPFFHQTLFTFRGLWSMLPPP